MYRSWCTAIRILALMALVTLGGCAAGNRYDYSSAISGLPISGTDKVALDVVDARPYVVSGDKKAAKDYIEGLDMLSSMRLCANVPGQWAVQTALGGYQSINDLVREGGRLRRQRDLAYELITAIPGVSCVKPRASLYMFPRLDQAIYPIQDDQDFICELLQEAKVLLVQGTGFNWFATDHFRLVFLPHEDDLRDAIYRIGKFLEGYRRRHGN